MTADGMKDIPDGATPTLDGAPIIYYLQDHPTLAPRFSSLFNAARNGRMFLNIFTITLAEVMTGPLAAGNEILAAQNREVLCRSPGWQTVSVDENVAIEAARLRIRYRLRLPDAMWPPLSLPAPGGWSPMARRSPRLRMSELLLPSLDSYGVSFVLHRGRHSTAPRLGRFPPGPGCYPGPLHITPK